METNNNVIVKYILNNKVLTPEELEKNKMYFSPTALQSKTKTDAILQLRQTTPANKTAILYCLANGTFKSEILN
ncbi:MAG: hypothetical protein ACKOXB_10180 [Flavobacteriales bacterium]